jgi:hypothetical protein
MHRAELLRHSVHGNMLNGTFKSIFTMETSNDEPDIPEMATRSKLKSMMLLRQR